MQSVRETVKCCGTVYSIDAWRLVYGYIVNHKVPDSTFETKMKKLRVSRSNAYKLYSKQLYEPWEIKFPEPKKAKRRLHISVKVPEKIPVPRARKRS
jgi:hypothetical protein